jgi:hypothetical protein
MQARLCLVPRTTMTTQTYEALPKVRTRREILTRKRAETSEVESFSEDEAAPKPLVAFDTPPARTPLPLTW